MRQGHLIQSGTPEQLYRQPMDAAAARFFSDTNEVKGRVAGAVVETCPSSDNLRQLGA